jgi:ribosome-interacting GTPase 1
MHLNMDYLLQRMWDYMGLTRIYTKRRGQQPDLNEPIVLSTQRHGLTVEAVCTTISKEFVPIFNFALVWGRSTKFNPQRVGLSHTLLDEDVIQVVAKTLVQQKHSKDYRQRVDGYNLAIAKERRRLRKIKT